MLSGILRNVVGNSRHYGQMDLIVTFSKFYNLSACHSDWYSYEAYHHQAY